MGAFTPQALPPIAAVVIDASVWVSTLLTQDSHHARADAWVKGYSRGGGIFTAPNILAIEVAAAVSRQTKNILDAQAAARQLYTVAFMRLVPMDQALVDEAADLAASLGLRGADALYVALAKQLGIPLASFDNQQLTLPRRIIQTIRP
jgi:predicted nucleic acid-binding protein